MSTENQYFNEIKFYKRSDNGYWYSTIPINGKRVYMHKYVWEYYNSPIPRGYEVHHIDLNKDNNNIKNLRLMRTVDHKKLHTELRKNDPVYKSKINENLKKAQEKAKKWHSSPEGRKWHSEHAKNIDYSKISYGERTCLYCGKTYTARKEYQKYCCNNCRSYATQKRKRERLSQGAII